MQRTMNKHTADTRRGNIISAEHLERWSNAEKEARVAVRTMGPDMPDLEQEHTRK